MAAVCALLSACDATASGSNAALPGHTSSATATERAASEPYEPPEAVGEVTWYRKSQGGYSERLDATVSAPIVGGALREVTLKSNKLNLGYREWVVCHPTARVAPLAAPAQPAGDLPTVILVRAAEPLLQGAFLRQDLKSSQDRRECRDRQHSAY